MTGPSALDLEPLDLAHNVNPQPAPACLDAWRAMGPADLYDYAPSFRTRGTSPLVTRLGHLYRVPIARIAMSYGAEDALKHAFGHFLRPGEVVAVPSVHWSYYRDLATWVGARFVTYPVLPVGDRYEVDVDALLRLRERVPVRMLLLASPSNPTGDVFPRDRLDEVLAAYRDAVVVDDEAYYGLGDVAPDPADLPALTGRYPNLLLIRTHSKLYGLAGLRVGHTVFGDGLRSYGALMSRYLGHSHPAERVALATFRPDAVEHYERVRAGFAADRGALYEAMAPLAEHVTVYRSQANFVLVKLSPMAAARTRAACAAARIEFKWFTESPFVDHARITLGTPEQNARVRGLLVDVLSPQPRPGRHDQPLGLARLRHVAAPGVRS